MGTNRVTVSEDPIRIAHILAPAPFGGLETVVQLLAAGQAVRGHDVTVIATIEGRAADAHLVVQALRRAGVRVEIVTVTGRGYVAERRAVARVVRELRPDIVHTHGYRADILHLPSARRAGIATATTLHGFTGGDWKLRLYQWAQLRAVARADAVICVSRPIASLLARRILPPACAHLIQNAFAPTQAPLNRDEARRALGIPDGTVVVGWVGRLSAEKAPELALDALAAMQDSEILLWVVGDGPERATLQARARATGIGERVIFTGAVPEAGRLLRAFDVLLLSSRTEGTPMVILEAMAAETPIVATAVGGVPDILTDRSALLVQQCEAYALADALRATFANLRAARARASQALADLQSQFGLDQWLDQHDALYTSILRRALRTESTLTLRP